MAKVTLITGDPAKSSETVTSPKLNEDFLSFFLFLSLSVCVSVSLSLSLFPLPLSFNCSLRTGITRKSQVTHARARVARRSISVSLGCRGNAWPPVTANLTLTYTGCGSVRRRTGRSRGRRSRAD